MASAFVAIDKYTADLQNLSVQLRYASLKFGRIESLAKRILDTNDIHVAHSLARYLLDTERPDIAFEARPCPKIDKVKFSSIADGVPAHIEFEGER